MEIEAQILSAIISDNLGQRITHATAVGLVAVFRQELARHREENPVPVPAGERGAVE